MGERWSVWPARGRCGYCFDTSDGLSIVDKRPRVGPNSVGGAIALDACGRSAKLAERIGRFLNISIRSHSSSSSLRARSVSSRALSCVFVSFPASPPLASSSSLDQSSSLSPSVGSSSSSESPPTVKRILLCFFFAFSCFGFPSNTCPGVTFAAFVLVK